MAVQGPITMFNRSKLYYADGTGLLLPTNTIKAVLCTSSQSIDATFTGSSGDCRYADLTAELATANGYTIGGVTPGSVALTRSSATTVEWNTAAAAWTLTNTITFKYMILYAFNLTNKNLIAFCDMDTGGGSVSPIAGTLTVSPNAAGWATYS